MPDPEDFPNFKASVDELRGKYHQLTHDLGHLICEAFGFDPKRFEDLFPYDDPDLAASLNHNLGMSNISPEFRDSVVAEFAKLKSARTGAHIDGPPFIAL